MEGRVSSLSSRLRFLRFLELFARGQVIGRGVFSVTPAIVSFGLAGVSFLSGVGVVVCVGVACMGRGDGVVLAHAKLLICKNQNQR